MVKRNNYGINFDLGVPLESEWELSNLYVPVYDEIQTKLSNWIKDSNDVICLGGQIGSGKSTAIQRAWLSAKQKPDVEFHFDREAFNLSAGYFWRIILAALIEKALASKADLSHLNIPKDLTGLSGIRWKQFLEILKPPRVEITLFKKRKKIQEKMVDNPDYVAKACEALIATIVAVSKKPLVFFASGIDKYDVDGAAFQDLLKPLQVLKKYKTLFELNVVHIYHPFFVSGQENYIFIPFFPENVLREILNRRMGAYSHNAERFINIAIQWSGGNPRQALRMLMELRQSKNYFQEGVILDAVHSLFFKYFGYTPKPDVDLLNVIRKQKEFDTTLLSLPGDKATARRAVYGNWIFLGEKCENGRVQAKLNPVVEFSVNLSISMTDPEIQLLNQYSEQRQMSGLGLDFNRDVIDSAEAWLNVFGSEFEEPINLNLVEILDVLKNSLFSKDRRDLIIVAYSDFAILEVVRAYLFAKANTYEYQSFKHFEIKDGQKVLPVFKFLEILKDDADILSVDFIGTNWSTESLTAIDKMRDSLLGRQMIWWIPEKELSRDLQYWTQLRQLFQVFILEDELLNSLKNEDIQADLEYFKDLNRGEKSSAANVVNNLKVVLKYLKHAREKNGKNY